MKSASAPSWSFAGALVELAAATLPSHRAAWGAAMRAELRYLGDRRSAWIWALGCMRVGLSERFRAKSLLDMRLVRWALALWLAYRAEDDLCNVALVLSYKAPKLGLKGLLTHCVQGQDYQRLIPLLDATRYWQLGLWTLISALYVLALTSILRRTTHAVHLFILAATLNVVCWLYELGEPLYFWAFPLADHLEDALLYGGTALLGWICWGNMRKHSSLTL